MKILVISSTPWAKNNSFGNTFNNLFEGIQGLSFCNIYCKPGLPDNDLKMECYQISEKKLIKSILDRDYLTGAVVSKDSDAQRYEDTVFGYETSRKLRFQVLFWIRDLIWKFGNWKTKELLEFVDGFAPDIIFQPIYYYPYLNEIAMFFHDHLSIPMIGYVSDDNYTLNKVNFSPLYWVDRFYNRGKVKKIIDACDLLYVISDVQQEEYQKLFSTTCKVLTKSADFSKNIPRNDYHDGKTIKFVYAGNLSGGRLKSLRHLVRAVKEINRDIVKILLDIYTPTPVSSNEFNGLGVSFHKAIPYIELLEVQRKADILVHVEGLSLKEQKEVHHSFSTKLVDYFALGKCIFAIGTDYQASIKHLIDNDAAIVASSKKEIIEKLKLIVEKPDLIRTYGEKAYECGKTNHNKNVMKKMLCNDLSRYGDVEYV